MTSEDHDDIHRVIALCFRGYNSMSDLDLERILSFDMEWLSPEEAEIAVNRLITQGWLLGNRDSLTPAFTDTDVTTPIGWFPRPSRLLEPTNFSPNPEKIDATVIEQLPEPSIRVTSRSENNNINLDPRAKMSNRLKRFISKQAKLSNEEIERRLLRKQNALSYATEWLCLALIAREQNLEMEQIITALSS